MLKNLVIFALLFGLFAHQHGDDSQPAARAAQSQNPSNPTAPGAAEQHNGSKLQQDGSQEQAPGDPKSVRIILPPKDNYDYWTIGVSITLAAVGIVGIGVGIWTLCYIRRQVTAMEHQRIIMRRTLNTVRRQTNSMEIQAGHMDSQIQEMKAQTAVAKTSAENALLNTTTLISAERAWIVVSVESTAPNQFNFIAKNVGRTPAKVKSIWSMPVLSKREDTLHVPTDEQTAESLLSTPPCLIPPTASQVILRCDIDELEKQGAFGRNMRFSQGFVNLWFYGRIVYFDFMQDESAIPHETKWLYWQVPIEGAIPFPDPMRPQHNKWS
jgi:hypothetical protein